ncbi:MAG: Tgt2/MlaC family protein [Planctomycetota bacterium]|jgi:phospholipid transport system substrate-binding protein
MKRFLFCFLVFIFSIQIVNAEVKEAEKVTEMLRSKWDAIVLVLEKKDTEQEVKEKEISKIVSPIFDFPVMAKLALGRKHWPKLTEPQREKFTELFIERLKISYREKISLYTDEKVIFKPAEQKKKTTIFIPMELISKDKKRSQFDDILSRSTVEDLLARLENPETE